MVSCFSCKHLLYICYYESSRTPQHSKWNCVGTNRPQHVHMYGHIVCAWTLNPPKIRIVHKNVHKVVWNKFWRDKSKQTRKCSQNITRNSNQAGGSQVVGWYSKTTPCFGKPNAPEFERFHFDTIRPGKDFWRDGWWKRTPMWNIHSAQKSGGFKAIRIDWCRARNWSCLKYWDCCSYWRSSTITEFPKILRTDFDKSW